MLARDLEMTVDGQEVTFCEPTVGPPKGDFDLFGLSAVSHDLARPFLQLRWASWVKGSHAIVHNDDVDL